MIKVSSIIAYIIILTTGTAFATVEFIYPAPSTWVKNANHLILKLNQNDLTAIRISVNGLQSDMIDVGSPEYKKLFQDFFIAQTVWDNGRNSILVDLFTGGQKIESAKLEIFYLPAETSQQAPPEFTSNTVHVPNTERLCAACHNVNPTPAQMNSSLEKENPCYRCHKKMLSSRYVHGPAGTYSCGFCHSNKGKPKHTVPKRGAALCYECHSDMAAQIKKRKFIHGPIEAGMCEVCHDSHGSPNESQLRLPINELCLSCHGHIKTQVHVVRTTNGEGHPLKDKPDPAKKATGRNMSCISCHNPHAADVRYYFVNNAEDRMQLCQMCHNK
ncbi:MAG TPA: cytochrome c3 family protein [Desulfuromonadaceae bacterium]|jgi:predicted CXXCH cytochrome family protein